MKRRRTYTSDFKISVIREFEMGKENARPPRGVTRERKNAFSGNGRAYKWLRQPKTRQMDVIMEMDVRNEIESGMGFWRYCRCSSNFLCSYTITVSSSE